VAGACSRQVDPPSAPDPIAGPSIACPSTVRRDVTAQQTIVTYPAPVVTHGAPPLTTSCTVPSGNAFPLGTTAVMCTVRDAQLRTAQCTFDVTLTAIPVLQGSTLLAFGDSVTCCEVAPPTTVQVKDPDHSYPVVLQDLVTARYTTQAVQVFQDGLAGESVFAGEDRFADALSLVRPDAVLLLEGTNDVNSDKAASDIVQALRADALRALGRGVRLVLLSTLLPQAPDNCETGVPCRAFKPEGVLAVNDGIRALSIPGVATVDMYAAFLPRVSTLIGNDGLHATVAGYQVMAQTFLAALEATFEVPLPPGPTPPAAAAARVQRSPR
jgi:lysophospholipase L1-like esterase